MKQYEQTMTVGDGGTMRPERIPQPVEGNGEWKLVAAIAHDRSRVQFIQYIWQREKVEKEEELHPHDSKSL